MRLSVSDAVLRAVRPLAWVALALSAGCDARDSSPNLLEVSDLNPHVLEVGDRLTLMGSGFPEGRAAKVSFQGDVFRAGRSPLRDVTIAATAAASDPHSIAVTLSAELAREFCGTGDAVHATFRGATSAAFQARESGAPPVRGTLEGVVLDVNPASISKAALAAHEAEAQRFADYAGMAVVHSEERDVLLIDTVDPEGRASRAGLLPGDALLELDGVRLASLSDLIPPPRARLSHVAVRRGDEPTPSTFALDVSGFQPGSPSELGPAATLLGFAVALLLLFASPLGRALSWLEGRLASQIRDRGRPSDWARARGDLKSLSFVRVALSELPSSPLPYFVFIMDSAWLTLLAMNRTIWARELDLPVLFLGSLTALCATALVLGGRAPGRRFSLLSGLRHVLLTLVFQAPVLSAMACAVLLSGSLRSDDILAAQGGWPWQWFAFTSPVALGIFVLLVLGLVPMVSRAPGALAAAASERAGSAARSRSTTLPEWSHLILTSGVISLVFLGGPRLPGVAAADPAAGLWLQVCAALLFQTKAVLVLGLVLLLRFATNQVRLSEVAQLGVRYLLPAAVLLLVASYFWAFGSQNPLFLAARVPLSHGLCFLTALCAAHVVLRVATQLSGERPRSAVNPWL
ncbi:MAG TPA: NADH-quinone oxidoreductase subunit H [Polyangiaceae bacterium]|nr:NADH-quinone oxidoreductase subunit H [Polyangiaceae bacterium]